MTSIPVENALHTACLLEVTARKPGNVHPLAAFDDCDWGTFAESAGAVAPVLAGAADRPLGETILQAVRVTNERVGRNTNLGMILLLAPLAAVPVGDDLRRGVRDVLNATTIDDCRCVYEAIRLASPGGIGKADREDVSTAPSVTLVEAMRLATDRDDVAKQYVTGFDDVFQLAERFDVGSRAAPGPLNPSGSVEQPGCYSGQVSLRADDLPTLEWLIITAHVERIAAASDSLIRRKCGEEIAGEAARRAGEVVAVGWVFSPSGTCMTLESRSDGLKAHPTELDEFDAWLRADGNRRNPGTTADLIAAALYVAIRQGRISCFEPAEIEAYCDELRRDHEMARE